MEESEIEQQLSNAFVSSSAWAKLCYDNYYTWQLHLFKSWHASPRISICYRKYCHIAPSSKQICARARLSSCLPVCLSFYACVLNKSITWFHTLAEPPNIIVSEWLHSALHRFIDWYVASTYAWRDIVWRIVCIFPHYPWIIWRTQHTIIFKCKVLVSRFNARWAEEICEGSEVPFLELMSSLLHSLEAAIT